MCPACRCSAIKISGTILDKPRIGDVSVPTVYTKVMQDLDSLRLRSGDVSKDQEECQEQRSMPGPKKRGEIRHTAS
jgi:hypothetical protein